MTCLPEHIPHKFYAPAHSAAKAFANLDNVLLATHVNPDGDALGSIAACGWMLKKLGRNFALYLPDGVPPYLSFLEMPGPVYNNLAGLPFKPESAVYLDCSDAPRLGTELASCLHDWPTLNIDHHLCEKGLGTIDNFIDTSAAATCQLVAYIANALSIPLKGKLAETIALGVITDTGHFSHGNTSGDVFALCSQLERNGLRIVDLAERLQSSWSLERARVWGICLQKFQIAAGGRISWCLITLEEGARHNIGKDDLEGLVDWLKKIKGVEIGIMGREVAKGQTRFSLRSKGECDIQKVAILFGGGGHKNASGCTIFNTPPEKAMEHVIEACEHSACLTHYG